MKFYAQILNTATSEIVKSVECSSERSADRVEMGMCINLNKDEYHTRVIDENGNDTASPDYEAN